MKRRTFVAGVAAATASLATSNRLSAQSDTGTDTGYAPVNGLEMYYEIHGSGGVPVILLHGAYMTISGMGELLKALATRRQVVAVEFQGHGHTADIDRPIRDDLLAGDVAALMGYLGIEQADIVGYSVGGNVALYLTMRYPELVRKLVSASSHYRLDALYPEVLAGIAAITPEMMMETPLYAEYTRVAPNPDDFPILVEKLKGVHEDFAWQEEDILAITAPALLVAGDADVIRPEHTLKLFRLLGGGVPGDLTGLPKARLAVLPGTTHSAVITRTGWLVSMITEFLDEPMPA